MHLLSGKFSKLKELGLARTLCCMITMPCRKLFRSVTVNTLMLTILRHCRRKLSLKILFILISPFAMVQCIIIKCDHYKANSETLGIILTAALITTDTMTLFGNFVVVGWLLLISSPVYGRKYDRRCWSVVASLFTVRRRNYHYFRSLFISPIVKHVR